MKHIHLLLLSLFSAVLLSVAFSPSVTGLLMFIGFLPLLAIENYVFENQYKHGSAMIFWYGYLTFGLWNLFTMWWTYKASMAGVWGSVFLNGFFMAVVFWAFHRTRRILNSRLGYVSLVVYWLAFELLHYHWDMSFPWLSLGNAFAKDIRFIQWYEFTGVGGGSLWVLLVNILIFNLYLHSKNEVKVLIKRTNLIVLIALLILPLTISFVMFSNYKETYNPRTVVAIQPNIDPYSEKFDGMSESEQLEKILKLADSLGDAKVNYFLAPETALPQGLWEENMQGTYSIARIRKFLEKYPKAAFMTGLTSYRQLKDGEPITSSARKMKGGDMYYEVYNSMILIDASMKMPIYHKSQLVLGAERMPFIQHLKFLNDFSLDLGGISGSLGTQKEPSVFRSFNDTLKIAPIICWESIYGEYVSEFVKKGAQILFVGTNDGWWGETPGYKTHLTFSQIRAIETRRDVVRSANTGVSCFINQRGEIFQPTKYWTAKAIKAQVNANTQLTFYTQHGDYIGYISSVLTGLLVLITIYFSFANRNELG